MFRKTIGKMDRHTAGWLIATESYYCFGLCFYRRDVLVHG
jgi:hypothetical protein